MDTDLKTTDLYLTAYLLSQNVTYKELERQGERRPKILFVFEPKLRTLQLTQAFRRRQAKVNVADFTYNLELARDLMFSKLRETN